MTSHYAWGSMTHTTWFWRCLGTAFGYFLLGSHNFMVTALGPCAKWPLHTPWRGELAVCQGITLPECSQRTLWRPSNFTNYRRSQPSPIIVDFMLREAPKLNNHIHEDVAKQRYWVWQIDQNLLVKDFLSSTILSYILPLWKVLPLLEYIVCNTTPFRERVDNSKDITNKCSNHVVK